MQKLARDLKLGDRITSLSPSAPLDSPVTVGILSRTGLSGRIFVWDVEDEPTEPASLVLDQGDPVIVDDDLSLVSTPDLVREFADLKVWFAVHETHGRTVEGYNRHHRLGAVVEELRKRSVL